MKKSALLEYGHAGGVTGSEMKKGGKSSSMMGFLFAKCPQEEPKKTPDYPDLMFIRSRT
jgi:hypothetical protein